jgi:hypothetical protein
MGHKVRDPSVRPPIEAISGHLPEYRSSERGEYPGSGGQRGSAKTTPNKLKTPMAALATNVPQRPMEDVSRIQAQAQDTEKLRAMPEGRPPVWHSEGFNDPARNGASCLAHAPSSKNMCQGQGID